MGGCRWCICDMEVDLLSTSLSEIACSGKAQLCLTDTQSPGSLNCALASERKIVQVTLLYTNAQPNHILHSVLAHTPTHM